MTFLLCELLTSCVKFVSDGIYASYENQEIGKVDMGGGERVGPEGVTQTDLL